MELKDIEDFKNKYNADLFFNTDIKKLNWFNIGGKSKIFFKPKNLIELKEFLKLYNNRGKMFILGMGSNVLFKDNTYEGVIIKLSNNFSTLSKLKPDTIIAGSACSQKKLSEFALENGISGFEFMYCIPGTIGGGIKMNSGCFGSEFKDKLKKFKNIFKEVNSYRCIGFEYIDIGIGIRNFAILSKLSPWDHIPGILFVREAGGSDIDFDKNKYDFTKKNKNLIVSNSEDLNLKILEKLGEYS